MTKDDWVKGCKLGFEGIAVRVVPPDEHAEVGSSDEVGGGVFFTGLIRCQPFSPAQPDTSPDLPAGLAKVGDSPRACSRKAAARELLVSEKKISHSVRRFWDSAKGMRARNRVHRHRRTAAIASRFCRNCSSGVGIA